jgi:hypothetical protein
MKSKNWPAFNELDDNKYCYYLDWAKKVQSNGLHCDKSVIQLAIIIYEKAKMNESQKY